MINLEQYLQNRMQEMNSFYSSIGLQTQRSLSTYEDYQEKKVPSQNISQVPSQAKLMENEFFEEVRRVNPFDEVPIKGSAPVLFFEEPPIHVEPKTQKKTFLKKGTRQYLSNAQTRSEIQKKEHEQMLQMNGEQVLDGPQPPKRQFLQKGKGKNCNSNNSKIESDLPSSIEQSRIDKVEDSIVIHTPVESLKSSTISEKPPKSMKDTSQLEFDKLKKKWFLFEQEKKAFSKFMEEQKQKLETEKSEFNIWKEEERKKMLKKQPKKIDDSQNKKNEEILRKQIQDLQEELSLVKQSHQLQINKLKRQLEEKALMPKIEQISSKELLTYAQMHQKSPVIQEEEQEDEEHEIDITQLHKHGKVSIAMINKIIPEKAFEYQNNSYFQKHKDSNKDIVITEQILEGKISRVYQSGKKEVVFANGVKREVFPDGYVMVHFTNHDIKQSLPDGTIVYFFSEAKTTQTTFPNGPNIYRFANGQIEIHHSDSKEIRFADGTQKFIKNGEEETVFLDGIIQKIDQSKNKFINYPNGSQDIFYTDGRKERRK